jgi:hypothetical protein
MTPASLARWLMAHPRGDTLRLRQVLPRGAWGEEEDVAPVQEWTRAGDMTDLATEIYQAAQVDAQDTGGMSRYRLVVLDGEEVTARKEWEAFGERVTEKSGVAEPATPAGLVAQTQRHLEARERASITKDEQQARSYMHQLSTMEKALERSEARNDRLLDRIQQLEDGRIAQVQVMEKMLSEQAERDLAAKRLESDLAYRRAMWERVEPAIPLVVNKALGRPLMKEDDGAFDLLESLVVTLKPAQLEALKAAFEPMQMTAFVKLWEAIATRVETREKKKADDAAKAKASTNGAPAS